MKDRSRPVLYVLLKKAFYGILQATMLFWFWKNLTANKLMNNKECTIL